MIDVTPARTVNVQLNGQWLDGAELTAWRYGPDGWLGRVHFVNATGSEVTDWLPADDIRTDPYRSHLQTVPEQGAKHRRTG